LNFNKNKKTTHAITDEELIIKYRFSHDTSYIGELFTRYTPLIYGVCLKYLKVEADAEDMTMTVFEKLLQDLKRFEVQHFSSWLYILVKNQCMMEFRKRNSDNKKGEVILMDELENVESGLYLHHSGEDNNNEETLQSLTLGINTLAEGQKECVELFYLKNKTYAETAVLTGYTLNQVKSFIQNGKRNLKIYLESKVLRA
jgi:RNA polymerase sigma factor (sigma-70 family)